MIDRSDDLAQFLARFFDVVELALQELVPLTEGHILFERKRVDWTHDAKLALEFAGASSGRHTLGQWRRFGSDCIADLDIEITPKRLDCAFEAHVDLGFFDLASGLALTQFAEARVGCGPVSTGRLEPGCDVADLVGLALALGT